MKCRIPHGNGAAIIGVLVACLFLVQSISSISNYYNASARNNEDLALAVIHLTHTIETMERKLDKIDQKLDASSLPTLPSTSASPITSAIVDTNDDLRLSKLFAERNQETGEPQKVLYYNLGYNRAGFGSLVNNLLYVASYQRLSQGRQLVVDEVDQMQYRKDGTRGMITGYFDTSFPVVSTLGQREMIEEQTGMDFFEFPMYNNTASDYNHPIIEVISHDSDTFDKARAEASNFFSHPPNETSPEKIHQFYTLTTEYCHGMKYNAQTQQSIHNMLDKAAIPDFATVGDRAITVAMHIRRGDKRAEAAPTPTKMYVEKLEQVLEGNNITSQEQMARVQHCFIATDDYAAFLDVKRAMSKSKVVSHCRMSTLASPTAIHHRDGADFDLLLAEMKMMVDATYFIGTWSSNIGRALTFFRGCKHPAVQGRGLLPVGLEYDILTEDEVSNQLDHYYGSYGVEGDEWFKLRNLIFVRHR